MRVPLRLNPFQWRNPFYWLNPYYWVPPRDVEIEGRPRRYFRALMIALHVVLVVAIVLGLGYVNRHYKLDTELLSPFPVLHGVWLPLLFLLMYGGAWLGYWFFRLLLDPTGGQFPDIDAAWDEGLAAVERAGIDPTAVPLFLVVGRPASGTADFFSATKLPFAVREEPRRPDAPLHVYANREAIFVTCEGASVLARLSQLLDDERKAKLFKRTGLPSGLMHASSASFDLLDLPNAPAEVAAGEAAAPSPGTGGLPAGLEATVLTHSTDDWLPKPQAAAFVGVAADEADRLAARLRYLGDRIADRRRPYCPANGVVWLLPLAGTESETAAEQTAAACKADRAAAEAGLAVHGPSAAVVCDAQDLPGFRDLLKGLAEPAAQERLLGRSFPLVPNVPAESRADLLQSGINWVTRNLVPGVVYQRFGSEAEGNGVRWSDANARMWRLTAELNDRRTTLARLVAQSLTDDPARPPLLAGVYLAGTGPDAADQAFAAGVVRQLITMQNGVSWTARADAEEADYKRMTLVGYLAMLAVVIAVGTLAYTTWVG